MLRNGVPLCNGYQSSGCVRWRRREGEIDRSLLPAASQPLMAKCNNGFNSPAPLNSRQLCSGMSCATCRYGEPRTRSIARVERTLLVFDSTR